VCVRPILTEIDTSTYHLRASHGLGLQFASDGARGAIVCFSHKEAEMCGITYGDGAQPA
jgi:hypothetical protein